jgi:hypothetical protein
MPFAVDKSTLANLLTGPARWLYAPTTVAVPTKLDDIVALTSPYAPKTGWIDGGATTDTPTYGRDMDSSDLSIQNRTTPVLKRITGTSRTLQVTVGEITAALMQIIENAPAPTTIAVGAAASGTPAQTRLDLGSISTLVRFRHALIAERDPGLGSSAEGGARGQLVAAVLYSAAVTADASDMDFPNDDLVGRQVTFQAYPDSTISDPLKAHGCLLFETGATVP